MCNTSLAYRISGYNRRRKWRIFWDVIKPDETTSILDVGFSEKEFSGTDNFLEKNYPYPRNITALGIATAKKFLERYPQVTVVNYDGAKFPFRDKAFDVCWSNAVIEHAGDYDRQVVLLKEIYRVSRVAFITTPNKYFPVEVHSRTALLHLLPKKYFDRYLRLVGKERYAGHYMNLLSLKGVRNLLSAAGIARYKIIRNRFCFFTLDSVVILGDTGVLQTLGVHP